MSPMGRDKTTELKIHMQNFYRLLEFTVSFVKLNQLAIRELLRVFDLITAQNTQTLLTRYVSKEPYCQVELVMDLMDQLEVCQQFKNDLLMRCFFFI